MDLKSGYPYWAVKNGLMRSYPPLRTDLHCDVAVIGAGITGAIIAHELADAGFDVAVFEQRDVGWGSSAASTALLQYEIDTHLTDLSRQHGEEAAAMAYRACQEAIGRLGDLARGVRDVDFAMGDSLYFASHRWHVRRLRAEFEARRSAGLDTHWLDGAEIAREYGFDAPAGLLTHVAARVDPYRLAHRLLHRLHRRGCRVHGRTRLEPVRATSRQVALESGDGARVTARHVVVAAGYEAQRWIDQRLARNRSSYACITEPVELGPVADTLLWETARPYLYLRSTGDSRLLVGGEDDAVDLPKRRDARVEKKADKLIRRVGELFPHLASATPSFGWAGTFAETEDGLPFFGPHPQWGPRVMFAMAYGGNGIVYAMLGAQLLRARLEGRPHPLKTLFGFERLR